MARNKYKYILLLSNTVDDGDDDDETNEDDDNLDGLDLLFVVVVVVIDPIIYPMNIAIKELIKLYRKAILGSIPVARPVTIPPAILFNVIGNANTNASWILLPVVPFVVGNFVVVVVVVVVVVDCTGYEDDSVLLLLLFVYSVYDKYKNAMPARV